MKKNSLVISLILIIFFSLILNKSNINAQLPENISIGLRGGGTSGSVQFKVNGLTLSGNDETYIRVDSNEVYTAKPIKRIYVSDETYLSISQEGIAQGENDFVFSNSTKEFKSASLSNKYPISIDNVVGIFGENNKLILAIPSNSDIYLSSSDFEPVEVFKKKYRGGLKFVVKGNALTTVNYLNVEEYLLGVVPREMSASWSLEALKAQAVSARSFAYSNYNKFIKSGFNLTDDTRSQAYGGFSAEHENSNKAVYETKGIVGYYNGKIAQLIYMASSGGKTENSGNIWSVNIPYLMAKDDPYSIGNQYDNWSFTLSSTDIEKALSARGKNIGSLTGITIDEITTQGYIIKITFNGTNSSVTYAKDSIRSVFGSSKLKSLRFKIDTDGSNYKFSGSGFGHGIGMSQYGAKAMAEKGMSYTQILNFYYRGITLNQTN